MVVRTALMAVRGAVVASVAALPAPGQLALPGGVGIGMPAHVAVGREAPGGHTAKLGVRAHDATCGRARMLPSHQRMSRERAQGIDGEGCAMLTCGCHCVERLQARPNMGQQLPVIACLS